MAPVHSQSSPHSPKANPPSPKSLLSSDQIPVSSWPASAISNLGESFSSPSPPSLLSEYARSTFQAEIPDSVISIGAPQATLASSTHCSKNLVSEGLGNCLASLGNFPVGSLPVNPGPSVAGGLDAGASPSASSSPPRQCVPCPSSVLSTVSTAHAILSAPNGALQFFPEVPRNSPAATPPLSADADNHGVSWSSWSYKTLLVIIEERHNAGVEAHPISIIASGTDEVSGPVLCPIQPPSISGPQGLVSTNYPLSLDPTFDGSDSNGSNVVDDGQPMVAADALSDRCKCCRMIVLLDLVLGTRFFCCCSFPGAASSSDAAEASTAMLWLIGLLADGYLGCCPMLNDVLPQIGVHLIDHMCTIAM
ncbi:hypothetical protein Nepgr_018774 [Nepenthes gracilis]|uniref:Uncharacterized protein n=1 Tax=Nepenthes gracilis TaxID=150966 RepID=A0AAD3XTS5_NEPGR|nr:hypothetical protein Nepgr_018774 [Nepenthes gracilis]